MLMLHRSKNFDAKRLPLPPPPDGHLLPNCWRCRRLDDDASQYRIRTSALMVWREQIKKSAGWALVISFVAALSVGLFSFGIAQAGGSYGEADAYRPATLGCGFFIASMGAGILISSFYLTSAAMAKLDVLRKERE